MLEPAAGVGGRDAVQGRAFIDTARELGYDDDPARFKETLRRIGRAKAQPSKPRDGEPKDRVKR